MDWYLLDVVVAEGAAVFELLAGENQALLVGRDAFLVLDLGLDIVDRVGGLDLKGDGLAREGLDEATGRFLSVLRLLRIVRCRWWRGGEKRRFHGGVADGTYICTV
jgi:hypothetical protein